MDINITKSSSPYPFQKLCSNVSFSLNDTGLLDMVDDNNNSDVEKNKGIEEQFSERETFSVIVTCKIKQVNSSTKSTIN